MKNVINITDSFPFGFTISDNRIEMFLLKYLKPSAFVMWRQLLRLWGGNRKSANPSLSKLSSESGISEKTIRKSIKELQEKGFIEYKSGTYNKSNRYYLVPIEKIMKKYYDKSPLPEISDEIDEDMIDISEKENDIIFSKDYKILNDFTKEFVIKFKEEYEDKFGQPYFLDKNDLKALKKNDKNIDMASFKLHFKYLSIFFKTTDKYISNSSYNLFFYFTVNVQRFLIKEYNETLEGKWTAVARKYFEKIKPKLKDVRHREELVRTISQHSYVVGGGSDRDKFVINTLIDLCTEYIRKERNIILDE